MKKFLKVLLIAIILVIVLFGIGCLRKVIIINKLNKVAEETKNKYESNFAVEINGQALEFDSFIDTEITVNKDEAVIKETSITKKSGGKIVKTTYNLEDEFVGTIETDDSKMYYITDKEELPTLNIYEGNLKNILSSNVKKAKLKDVDVYIISTEENIYFVNAKNGLILKTVDLLNNTTHEYKYELGNVKEEIELPDLEGYERLYLSEEN